MKKNKKIIFIIILIMLLLTIGIILYNKTRKNVKNIEEYQPEEEISINQEREAIVSLYFKNKATNNIEPEARLIDVKNLVSDPYNTILNLLIDGPKNNNLESVIPNGTKINSTNINGETLIIDFSEEFINNQIEGKDAEEQTLNSIVKTMTELSEINSIKILINGEEDKEFKDGQINFKNNFIREE